MKNDRHTREKYCIVIASHNPPIELLFDTLKKLSKMNIDMISLIDSSNYKISEDIQLFVKKLTNFSGKQNIFYQKVENYGIGHKYNLGFDNCLRCECDVITILTDDVIVNENKFKPEEINDYFYHKLDINKDMLSLCSFNYKDNRSSQELEMAPDFGMTLSRKLIKKVRFKESLILEYTDIEFSRQIRQNGGKIILYPEKTVTSIPEGSRTSENIPHRPVWRIYLLVRNSLVLSREYKDFTFSLKNMIYITEEIIKSCKHGEKSLDIFKAAFLGVLDGFKGKLGNTDNLRNLSGNLFYDLNQL